MCRVMNLVGLLGLGVTTANVPIVAGRPTDWGAQAAVSGEVAGRVGQSCGRTEGYLVGGSHGRTGRTTA